MCDGEGHRVEQYTSGGNGNQSYYLPGNVEEVTPSGSLITTDSFLYGDESRREVQIVTGYTVVMSGC